MQRFSWADWFKAHIHRSRFLRSSSRRRVETTPCERLECRTVLAAPTLAALSNVTLLAGSPLLVSLDGSDADGQRITYSVQSSSANVEASVLRTGRSLDVVVASLGTMKFNLLEDYAYRAIEHVTTLAESGFYAGSLFHKVHSGNIFTGDPTGIPPGTGGSSLGPYDDQFHLDLQHNRAGLLSATKLVEGLDDQSDSQVFVTGSAQRSFDFDNTIFGVLVEGESVRQAIAAVPTTSQRPNDDVVVSNINVTTDIENGVLLLKAASGVNSGTLSVTVTATDSSGESTQRVFQVTVQPDNAPNSSPFLAELPTIRTLANTPTTFQLTALDAEGDASAFLDQQRLQDNGAPVPVTAPANLAYSVGQTSGLVTVTPSNNLTGTHDISVATGLFISALDYQVVPIEIVASALPLTISAADHPSGPQNDDGRADVFEIKKNGTNIEVRINGVLSAQSEALAVSLITLNGSSDDDSLVVDFSGGDPTPLGGIVFNAGTHVTGDAVRFTGSSPTNVTHNYVNATADNVVVDGSVVSLTGVESICDLLVAAIRVFNLPSTDDVLTLGDDGAAANNESKLSSTGTTLPVTFRDPVAALTLNLDAGNDTLVVNSLDSGARAVTVFGGAGNDSITGSSLSDLIHGDAGNDTISGTGGNDSLFGGADNDRLLGGSGSDFMQGNDGHDFVDGGGTSGDSVGGNLGDDTVSGGAGDNTLYEGGEVLSITLTNTAIHGLGNDTFSNINSYVVVGSEAGNVIDLTAMTLSATVYGNGGNDTILGGSALDALLGMDGNDVLVGNGGPDNLNGGAGADSLDGGDGNDRLNGLGGSNDSLRGGLGDDTFTGGSGSDLIIESADVNFVLTPTRLTGLGTDRIVDAEGVRLTGGASNNTLDARLFTAGAVTLDGGSGNDSLMGTGLADSLLGGSGHDSLDAGDGSDTLVGGTGSDSLIGGSGNDRLFGQEDSNDKLIGGAGDDSLDGGTGEDIIIETVSGVSLLTNTSLTGNGVDVVVGIEQASLTGSNGADSIDASGFTVATALVTLDGGSGNDTLRGSAGSDYLIGGDGDDILRGGSGHDTLDGGNGHDGLSGAAGNDLITTGDGNDTGFGGSGNDTLLGSTGNDLLYGGAGVDSLRGHAGTDTIAGGSGTGAQTGDITIDNSADINEFFVLTPIPNWADEI